MKPRRCFAVLTLLALGVEHTALPAQGITTAAVQGTVAEWSGAPIANAAVELVNTATGQQWRVESSGAGRYFVENAAIGGPFAVRVRAIGFVPATRNGINLTVGQRYTADFALDPASVELPEVVVQADANPQAHSGRTGPAQLVSDSALRQLPNHYREATDLTLLSRSWA